MQIFRRLIIAILAILIITFVGCNDAHRQAAQKPVETKSPSDDYDSISEDVSKENNTYKDSFIFPYSNKEVIREEELETCDKFTLLLAKNELFARKGYKFKDKELSEYFDNKDWYKPSDEVPGTIDVLNEVERQNFSLIDNKYKDYDYQTNLETEGNNLHFEKDINGDGIKETITASFEDNQNIYKISIDCNGKEYHFEGSGAYVTSKLFFADFDDRDQYIEFYVLDDGMSSDPTTIIYRLASEGIEKIMELDGCVSAYNGKGRIYTEFCKTYDKYKQVLAYYELDKGVFYATKEDLAGRPLEYDYRLVIYKDMLKMNSKCSFHFTTGFLTKVGSKKH